MKNYQNRNNKWNSSEYHTGKDCIEPGCHNPAGTWWSPLWCFQCNVKRMDRITMQLEKMANDTEDKNG
jgi:hypothetical protein